MSLVSDDVCGACGHDRAFHQIGTGNGVPVGTKFCDDRHAPPCGCTGFVPLVPRRTFTASEIEFERKAIENLVKEASARDFDDRHALIACLLSAVRRCDWHLVSDMANDLRVLEASKR